MNGFFSLRAICLCGFAVLSANIDASVVYSYDGNNYNLVAGTTYDASMKASGSITVAAALSANFSGNISPVSYNFSDGVYTYTESNSSRTMYLETDASGAIVNWNVTLFTPVTSSLGPGDIQSVLTLWNNSAGVLDYAVLRECNGVVGGSCNSTIQLSEYGRNENSPGVWTVSAVPLPATLWLMGSGLFGLLGVARRVPAH